MRTLNINKTLPLPFTSVSRPFIFKLLRDKTLANYDTRVRFFWLLVGVAIMSLATYIYAITFTAKNVGERQALENEVARITADLNTLEFKHIELENKITLELAHEYGFSETKAPLYISRQAGGLSYNKR